MSRPVKYLLVLALIILGVGFGVLLSFNKNTGVNDYQAMCKGEVENIACVVAEAARQGGSLGPDQALSNLAAYVEESEINEIECHSIYHAVGSTYYNKFKEKSYVNGINTCLGAYYHGILQESSKQYKGGIEQYADQAVKFCKNFSNLDFYHCMHGIGHTAYHIADKNYEKAVDICKQTNMGVDCSAGVYMEIVDDVNNAKKLGMENFDNFQPRYCEIFENKTLKIACLIQSGINAIVDRNTDIDDLCNYGNDLEAKECKLYHGVSIVYILMPEYPSYQLSKLEPKREVLEKCLKDENCFNGLFSTSRPFFPEAKKAEENCLFFVDNFGTEQMREKCVNRPLVMFNS